ncbi:MAG: MFS transporter [Oscillospiraceae bacterium]|jgi:MFS family permease|nr:MFS transporter [Oscillospiraceae bacterium]
MGTILLVALLQMAQITLNPAIDTIVEVFSPHSLADVQKALALISIVSMLSGVVSAPLISRGVFSKRAAMLAGLTLLGVTGICSLLLHTEFWHLQMLSVMVGAAMGLFIVNTASVFFDNFTDEERQPIAGYQTSCINAGGIFWNLAGGILCTLVWYGGYLMLMLALPVTVLAWFTVPKTEKVKKREKTDAPPEKMKPMIFYYCAILGIFMAIYNVVGANIATHLRQAGVENPAALAGFASAAQMAGGVVCGLFFGKLSAKLGDLLLACACLALVVGFALLGLFPNSIVITFIAMFVAGMSLSFTAPRVMFAVSALANLDTSAIASALANSIAPSLGAFVSPYIFTEITLKLFGEATGSRYLFTAGVAAVFGAVIVAATLRRRKSGYTDMGEKI